MSRSAKIARIARITQIRHIGSSPTVVPSCGTGPVPSANSVPNVISSSAAYNATSSRVRTLPLVNGTRPGHGGSRMVSGRSQYRIEPIGGKNRLFNGPKPQPSPITSNSIV